jgi:hypothetical protein
LFEILSEATTFQEKGPHADAINIKKFTNDLYIIMEAGFACYSQDICKGDLKNAPLGLLTNNMKLIRTFIENKKNRKALETAINLNGLEHLITLCDIETVLNKN